MLGGVAEIYAYGSSTEVPAACCNSGGDASKACNASSAVFGGFRNTHALPEDFILFAECDENCGPEPLIVIPKGSGKGIDLVSLTLKLLSSDYQGYGTSNSVPIQDTQALFPDVLPNVHAVVNYFALADVHSRGYVRPVAVAYLSSDKFKLIQNFLPLKKYLSEACRTIKFHNKCLFVQEIEATLKDLILTKEAMQDQENSHVLSNLTVPRLQEELLDVTVSDLQSIQEKLQPLIEEEYQEHVQDAESFLEYLREAEPNNFISTLTNYKWHFQKNNSSYKPQFLKLPLRSNFTDALRPTEIICDVGFLIGLYYFHIIHKIFIRKHENILLTSEEQSKGGKCLKFGACLKESVYKNTELSKCGKRECQRFLNLVPVSHKKVLKDYFKFMDNKFLSIVFHFYTRNSNNNSLYSDNKVNSEMENSLSFQNSCRESSSPCHWHGCSTSHLLDVIDQMEERCPDLASALDTLQGCGHLPDIFYSLLMGQCIVITGPPERGATVQALVRVLSVLCPRDHKGALYAQPWREVPVRRNDLDSTALLGVPLTADNSVARLVPSAVLAQVSVWNIKSGSFSGFSYKGVILNDLSKRIKSVTPKGPMLATLVSFLADLELTVLVWRAMCKKSNQGSVMPNKYFMEKGYSQNDLDILETLSTMVS